ncbi:MAG: DUF4178 domain-containing protein [Planctomycetes bacterium]|nr:DUF4178 domain-containing protein [Planctomycetota bacterium]
MVVRKARCPGCGGEVRFDLRTSVVTVCPHCVSAVARGDQKVEDLGKVADLAETQTPFSIGLRGKYGLPFELKGRVQFRHSSGAVWDEWFAAFSDGRVGWLSEAQGRYFLTFPRSLGREYPRLEDLRVGKDVRGLGLSKRMVVNEVNQAIFVGGEGEIPFRLEPGREYTFADLSGEDNTFGNLDFTVEPPRFYLGRKVTLRQLGIRELTPEQAVVERAAPALQVKCPKCAGTLELRAPDKTERVGCPYCGSLLEAKQGTLAFLQALKGPKTKPVVPLGSIGMFEQLPHTVIGFLVRSCVVEGERYYWQEYLLFHPQLGFRWLVRSDDHWTYVTGVEPGEVREEGRDAVHRGRRFRRYQDSIATVVSIVGEIYWRVTVGEAVEATDYSAPPSMLSREVTLPPPPAAGKPAQASEVNWSLGTYVHPQAIEQAFQLKERLPRPNEDHPCKEAEAVQNLSGAAVLGAIVLVILVLWVLSEIQESGAFGSGGSGSFGWSGGSSFSFGGK